MNNPGCRLLQDDLINTRPLQEDPAWRWAKECDGDDSGDDEKDDSRPSKSPSLSKSQPTSKSLGSALWVELPSIGDFGNHSLT